MCNSRGVFCMIGTQHWHFCFSLMPSAGRRGLMVANVLFFTLYTGTNGFVCLFFAALFSHLFQRSPWTTICILEGLFFICSCLSTGLVTFWLLVNLQGRIDKVGCTLCDFDNLTSSQPSDAAWRGFHSLRGRRELSCSQLARAGITNWIPAGKIPE